MLLRSLVTLLVTLCLLAINSAASVQNDDEIDQAIADAMAALDQFMLAFNAKDPEAWAASFNYPHVRFASGEVTVWETPQEHAEYAEAGPFVVLPQQGWDHSHWLGREVTLASPDKVHVSTVFQRFNSDNEPIATYQSLYIVTNVDGHWGTQARSSLAP